MIREMSGLKPESNLEKVLVGGHFAVTGSWSANECRIGNVETSC